MIQVDLKERPLPRLWRFYVIGGENRVKKKHAAHLPRVNAHVSDGEEAKYNHIGVRCYNCSNEKDICLILVKISEVEEAHSWYCLECIEEKWLNEETLKKLSTEIKIKNS